MTAAVIDLCGEGLCMEEATHRFHSPIRTSYLCDRHVAVLRKRAAEKGIDADVVGAMLERLRSNPAVQT